MRSRRGHRSRAQNHGQPVAAGLAHELARMVLAEAAEIEAAEPPIFASLAELVATSRLLYGEDAALAAAQALDPIRRDQVLCARREAGEHVRLRDLAARLKALPLELA